MLVAMCLISEVPASSPVTVNVWGVFQSSVVKVREAGDTVALAGVPKVAVTVTESLGRESSTTV